MIFEDVGDDAETIASCYDDSDFPFDDVIWLLGHLTNSVFENAIEMVCRQFTVSPSPSVVVVSPVITCYTII